MPTLFTEPPDCRESAIKIYAAASVRDACVDRQSLAARHAAAAFMPPCRRVLRHDML